MWRHFQTAEASVVANTEKLLSLSVSMWSPCGGAARRVAAGAGPPAELLAEPVAALLVEPPAELLVEPLLESMDGPLAEPVAEMLAGALAVWLDALLAVWLSGPNETRLTEGLARVLPEAPAEPLAEWLAE